MCQSAAAHLESPETFKPGIMNRVNDRSRRCVKVDAANISMASTAGRTTFPGIDDP